MITYMSLHQRTCGCMQVSVLIREMIYVKVGGCRFCVHLPVDAHSLFHQTVSCCNFLLFCTVHAQLLYAHEHTGVSHL